MIYHAITLLGNRFTRLVLGCRRQLYSILNTNQVIPGGVLNQNGMVSTAINSVCSYICLFSRYRPPLCGIYVKLLKIHINSNKIVTGMCNPAHRYGFCRVQVWVGLFGPTGYPCHSLKTRFSCTGYSLFFFLFIGLPVLLIETSCAEA
jgi:hypothetical protein